MHMPSQSLAIKDCWLRVSNGRKDEVKSHVYFFSFVLTLQTTNKNISEHKDRNKTKVGMK